MRARAALVSLIMAASVAGVAPAQSEPLPSLVTALELGASYLGPDASSVPISVSYTSGGWTTVTLRVLDAAGAVVRTIDTRSGGSGTYATAWDGRDAAGEPVADGTYTIEASAAGYLYDRTVGGPGTGAGQLRLPLAVDEAPDGTLWVADVDRVVHYDASGAYLGEFPYARPSSIRFDNEGRFLVANGGSVVTRHDATGAEVARITFASPNGWYDAQQFSNGNFVLGGLHYPFAPGNTCCAYWTLQKFQNDFSSSLGNVGGIQQTYGLFESGGGYTITTGGSDGTLWGYTEAGARFWGSNVICYAGPCANLGPMYGIERGDSGGPIVSMYTRHQIAEFSEFTNAPLWVLGSNGTNHGQFAYPYGVTRAGDRLYVADQYNNRVEVYQRSANVRRNVVVDSRAPRVTGLVMSRDDEGRVLVHVSASDEASGASPVTAIEIFYDESGEEGSGQQLHADDGAFDAATETGFDYLRAPEGSSVLLARARDAAGNWGPVRAFGISLPGEPVTLRAVAARAMVTPGAIDGEQIITATLLDQYMVGVRGVTVGFSLCRQGTNVPSLPVCVPGSAATDEQGVARWTVPSNAVLMPGSYTVGVAAGELSASASFVVLADL